MRIVVHEAFGLMQLKEKRVILNMVDDVKQAIVDELNALFPAADGYAVYDDHVPQDITTPYFLILLTNQDYSKKLNTKYQSTLSFDLAYYSNKETTKIRTDCHSVQEVILRAFDLVGTYRVKNKKAYITDDVLHITFAITYSEMKEETTVCMQQAETTTNI